MPNSVRIISATPSVAIVSLLGEHDLGDSEPLKVAFARAAIRAPNVIVDLSDCSFIDSTVIALLLHAQSVVAQDGGRFAVALPTKPNAVTRVVDLMQLVQLVPVYASVEDALATFGQPQPATARPA
jgi:anti-anti-sigma factor